MAIRCLKLAGLYLILGMTLGIAMGATERFALAPAHAHVNLLGWVTLALAAAVFTLWPESATTRLARAFFWLYSLALPPAMLALSLVLLGQSGWMPVLIAGQVVLYVAAILFVANILLNVRSVAPVATASTDRGYPRQAGAVATEIGRS